MVNVHDGGRATSKFRVYSSSSHLGPWRLLVDGALKDSREENSALGIENFSFKSTTDHFFKFELVEWFGVGGGLQFFDVKGELILKIIS